MPSIFACCCSTALFVAKVCMFSTRGIARRTFTILSFLSSGVSSATRALPGSYCCKRTCPQKLNTFWLTVSWKPLTKASVIIMAATLTAVAVTDSLIIKREKDFCGLKAMRRAMKRAISNRHDFSNCQSYIAALNATKAFKMMCLL